MKDNALIDGIAQFVGHHDALVAMSDLLRFEVLLCSYAVLGLFDVTARMDKSIADT